MALFAPSDPAFVANPYPAYAQLRARPGLERWNERGMWLVARHGEVSAVLRDRRLGRVFTQREPRARFEPWNFVNELSMLELEPPDHTRLRRLVSTSFTPRRVESLRPAIAAIVDALLDEAAEQGTVDLVQVLAEPLPVEVIAELLGVPRSDRQLLRPWSNAIVALYEPQHDEATAEAAIRAARDFTSYLRGLVAERRSNPADDLLSGLVLRDSGSPSGSRPGVASDEGERLTEDEVVVTAILLLNAGHEASVNVAANGVVALLSNPDQLARLRDDPALAVPAVDELIRFDSPLSLFDRVAFEDLEVAGQHISAGERVGLLLGAANHDAEAFEAPERLDIGRRPNHHVGFGAGIHFCLGAPLARLELQISFSRLVQRFPALALAGEPVRRPSFQFRGFASVPVRLA